MQHIRFIIQQYQAFVTSQKIMAATGDMNMSVIIFSFVISRDSIWLTLQMFRGSPLDPGGALRPSFCIDG